MDKKKPGNDLNLFDNYTMREIPIEGDFISFASEIGAILNRHAKKINQIESDNEKKMMESRRSMGRIARFVFHLEDALKESEKQMLDAGLRRIFKRMRVIKDQLKSRLFKQGYTWLDPMGKDFEEIANFADVIGWRHRSDFDREIVDETIEPVILYQGEVLLEGSVIMGASECDE